MRNLICAAALGASAVSSFLSRQAFADTVTVTAVAPSSGFESLAVDPTSGKIYERAGYGNGYGGDGTVVRIYDNVSALASSTQNGSVTLSGNGFFGTYFAVVDGEVYGRTDNSSSAIARWNATTGTEELTSSISGMGGTNGSQTFNWGGFSGVNWMEDSTGLYVFGDSASSPSTWLLEKMNTDLTVQQTWTYNAPSGLGYAFIINGKLFTSSSYGSTQVTGELDLATGVQTTVNFNLAGISAPYIDDATYDQSSDTLYVGDAEGSTTYAVSGASVAFGAPANDTAAVPLPSTALGGMTLLGTLALLKLRRRKAATA